MLVFLSEISQDTYIEPSKIKLQDWLQTWIDEFSFDKRYSTLKGYKAQIKKHIVPALGKYYLEELTPLLIQRFYNDLIRPDEDGKCLSLTQEHQECAHRAAGRAAAGGGA